MIKTVTDGLMFPAWSLAVMTKALLPFVKDTVALQAVLEGYVVPEDDPFTRTEEVSADLVPDITMDDTQVVEG